MPRRDVAPGLSDKGMASAFALQSELDRLRTVGRYRRRRVVEPLGGARIAVDGKPAICFSGNDYLGLAHHPRVVEAFRAAASRFGVGSGASHLVSGHGPLHHELEERLADVTGRPRALVFSSGYAANLGVAAALLGRSDVLVQDKLNHASLLDAARLSGASLKRYGHASVSGLSGRLEALPEGARCLVATDGVFSMDGDVAPLSDIADACDNSGAWLMVDDAHGFGVLGTGGRGSVEAAGCGSRVQVYMATLGKALGVGGAFVAGSEELIETLVQSARTYVYTTATPPAMAAATLASLDLLDAESWRIDRLHGLIGHFRRGAVQRGLALMPTMTPIQPLLVGADERAVRISERLLEAGFFVVAIRPPTVPEGMARLRITLSAEHDATDVDALLDALADSVDKIGAQPA
jgi:8-amino-7-oxononanoate synthase